MQTDFNPELEYVGFWARLWASIIDSVLVMLIVAPLIYHFYGADYLQSDTMIKGPVDFILTWVFPALAVIIFWIAKSATPGKMAIKAVIVDASTGAKPTSAKLLIRYLGYYVSMLPLFLGFIWVAFDKKKQGFHDKMANTVVVRKKKP